MGDLMPEVGPDPSVYSRRRPPDSAKGVVMPESRRHVAKAVAELRSPATGELEGWLYRWEDGSESMLLLASLPSSVTIQDAAGPPQPDEPISRPE